MGLKFWNSEWRPRQLWRQAAPRIEKLLMYSMNIQKRIIMNPFHIQKNQHIWSTSKIFGKIFANRIESLIQIPHSLAIIFMLRIPRA